MKSPSEKLLAALKKANSAYKFRELKRIAGCKTNAELERLIADLRRSGCQVIYRKLDGVFTLSRIPTPYSNVYDLSHLPQRGVLGLISDTHLCSIAERLDLLHFAYDKFVSEGAVAVLHSADLMDGWNVYKGHVQFVKVGGALKQAAYFMANYPQREGLTTYAISGNHDNKSYLENGVDQVSAVVNGFELDGKHYEPRTDIVYLGQYSRYLKLPQEVSIQLLHPQGGNAYSKSYRQQKRAWAMHAQTAPDIEISGHFHTFNFLREDDTYMISMPGMQDETEFFKRLGLPRELGFVLMEYDIRDAKLRSLKVQLVPLE